MSAVARSPRWSWTQRGGSKTSRRPDITTKAPDGSTYHENVERGNADGTPVARERRALDDIEKALGKRPGYTTYQP